MYQKKNGKLLNANVYFKFFSSRRGMGRESVCVSSAGGEERRVPRGLSCCRRRLFPQVKALFVAILAAIASSAHAAVETRYIPDNETPTIQGSTLCCEDSLALTTVATMKKSSEREAVWRFSFEKGEDQLAARRMRCYLLAWYSVRYGFFLAVCFYGVVRRLKGLTSNVHVGFGGALHWCCSCEYLGLSPCRLRTWSSELLFPPGSLFTAYSCSVTLVYKTAFVEPDAGASYLPAALLAGFVHFAWHTALPPPEIENTDLLIVELDAASSDNFPRALSAGFIRFAWHIALLPSVRAHSESFQPQSQPHLASSSYYPSSYQDKFCHLCRFLARRWREKSVGFSASRKVEGEEYGTAAIVAEDVLETQAHNLYHNHNRNIPRTRLYQSNKSLRYRGTSFSIEHLGSR
ncbi:hypothetical protein BDQ17DRAFT_1332379 [Cyathus striatus]|nr:hypothetical protein BDQ17DRAFT_1332379 [Cyathus striatus]